MKKLILSTALLAAICTAGQAQEKNDYYVKHVEFPQGATLEQKVDMAARLVPTPQQLEWQQMELTAFLHFGINTFTGLQSHRFRCGAVGTFAQGSWFQDGHPDSQAS